MIKRDITQLDFGKLGGIIPAIVQDAQTKAVLMLGFMNKEALNKTMENRRVTFWSRSRKRLWEKGETSGNKLTVVSVTADCDRDALLILAEPTGPTCHTNAYSCFEGVEVADSSFVQELYDVVVARKQKMPKNSYTASLFKQGLGKIVGKVEEESGEVLQAARKESRARLIEESADLLYHMLVLLAQKNITPRDVIGELKRRKR